MATLDDQKLREKIAVFADQPPQEIQESTILGDLISDSYELAEMIFQLEQEFELNVDIEGLTGATTVAELKARISPRVD